MLPFLFFMTLLATTSCSQAIHLPHERSLSHRAGAGNASTTPTNVSLPVDHFTASDYRMFDNRYWYNDEFYKPGGPIIIWDAGEGFTVEDEVERVLVDGYIPFSPALEVAKAHDGLVLYWEHRYYGSSQPCPVNYGYLATVDANCSYQYLTMDQALEDVVYFANHPNFPGYSDGQLVSMNANNTPWIFIGGSYPGARAAWLRVRNPETIFASWASSAVVNPFVDGSVIFNTMMRSQPSNCTADMHAAVTYMDSVFRSDDAAAIHDLSSRLEQAQKVSLTIPCSERTNDTTLCYLEFMLDATYNRFQSYGPVTTSDVLCEHFEAFNAAATPSNASALTVFQNPGDGHPTAGGLLASGVDVKMVANAYMYAVVKYLHDADSMDSSASVSNSSSIVQNASSQSQALSSRNLHPRGPSLASPNGTNWGWQIISQFGMYQGWTPEYAKLQGNKTIVSSFISAEHFHNATASSYFGYDPDLLPSEPNVAACTKYGGWNMTPSNVMFTVGEFDPWRPNTVFSVEEELGAPMRQATQEVPACGEAPQGSDIFGTIYPNAAHVADGPWEYFPDGPDAATRVGFELFDQALKQWLPCFKAKNGSQYPSDR